MPASRTPVAITRGFTLVELVLVIAIMSIAAAIASPRYANSLRRYHLDAAAKRIAADIEHVGAYAKARSAPQTVVFDVAGCGYSSVGLQSPDRRQANYAVNLAKEPYRVTLVSADFGGSATATFTGYGTPAGAGSVVVGAGSEGRRISLDAITGKASIVAISIP